jgi:hypothetical protein
MKFEKAEVVAGRLGHARFNSATYLCPNRCMRSFGTSHLNMIVHAFIVIFLKQTGVFRARH